MKISDIVSQISDGLARSNRFIVNLTPPTAITSGLVGQGAGSTDYVGVSPTDYRGLHKILLLCDSAQLPGINLNTAPIRSFGEVRQVPYELAFEPITLTFYVDADMNVKKMFDLWIMATQIGDSRKFRYYDSYTTTLSIYVQDMQEDNRYIVEMYEAYPRSVGAVQVDFANKDVMKLQVTMNYKYWRSSQVAYSVKDVADKPEFFDYTTNINQDHYLKNFNDFQQDYNIQYGSPENYLNYTGDTVQTT